MIKKIFMIFVLSIFLFNLTGCATASKQRDMEAQGLRNQVAVLKVQVKAKDDEISSLKEELNKVTAAGEAQEKKVSKKIIGEVKSRPNVKQVQIALSNAGYNAGPIDGRMGKQTRDAIKAFQRANNLSADGTVGKKTWILLKEYLYKKVK